MPATLHRICPVCARQVLTIDHRCRHCAASLSAQPLPGRPAHAEADPDGAIRARRRRRDLMITGVLTVGLLQFLFGLPGSLLPTEWLWIALAAVVIGAPLAWLIDRTESGRLGGALCGVGVGAVLGLVSGAMQGGGIALVSSLIACAAMCGVPGVIIGLHAETAR